MEQVHGVDVSWMTRGSPRDKVSKASSPPSKTPGPAQPRSVPAAAAPTPSPRNAPVGTPEPGGASARSEEPAPTAGTGTPKRIARPASAEKQGGSNVTPPQRRNSWFSNISAKFTGSSSTPPASINTTSATNNHNSATSASHHNALHHLLPKDQQAPQASGSQEPPSPQQSQPQPQCPAAPGDPPPPKLYPSRNAVLQHAAKPEGSGPYTPAPPKSGQAGILGVLRRLSSTGANAMANGKLGNGLVERRTLNVDHHRERCPIAELKDAKLRRVSFCVDVEIAPMPKYADAEVAPKAADRTAKKKATDKGEGEALRNPKMAEAQKEAPEGQGEQGAETQRGGSTEDDSASPSPPEKDKDGESSSKKKEKKKKSEEERKARKEKRRRLAEDNSSVPLEIHYDSSDSSSENRSGSGSGTPSSRAATTAQPTTNPARIYRRCCQLRETPILKKITEQLTDSANSCTATGVVGKLDLTDYWLQLPDLVTLGDYLAVVPVREVILENCGLSDEGLRVMLAGLLAAKPAPSSRRRKARLELEEHGGVVERVVLKNNKLGPDGWKHIALFLYMCRSLKYLDVSHIPFPKQPPSAGNGGALPNGKQMPRSISDVLSKALAERPGGAALEMLNIGGTEPSMDQLGTIMDGVVGCGVRRLGLAHNRLDERGVALVARYLAVGKCEGLDLGGNDLRDHMDTMAGAVGEQHPLWALSLAGCNLDHSALGKMLPALVKLSNFRFIDLSHNHDLFQATPSAVGLLRRYLPQMQCLKRMHLQDVNMNAEQAIAIAEVLPEVSSLAHINLLGNTELVKLADARTEEAQEEACALYASLLAATRVSRSLICVDIEVPREESGEIVKAMAKQVVAYCLRNMERMPDTDIGTAAPTSMSETQSEVHDPPYPDVLVHLVGHDVLDQDGPGTDDDSGPDEDYVIGGTGVVKALTCCLKNRGEEAGRQPGELMREMECHKAKDMSKHLLRGARKIRIRLQPALAKAKANPGDELNLRKLVFLDDTLQGIIKRFEDEFPDTREPAPADGTPGGEPAPGDEDCGSAAAAAAAAASASSASGVAAMEGTAAAAAGGVEDSVVTSDGEDESAIHPAKRAPLASSELSRVLAEEEGRMLRAGHRLRAGLVRPEHLELLSAIDDVGADAKHAAMLHDMAEDIGGELLAKVREKGAVRAFREDKEVLYRCMRESDPDYWDRFIEAQHKARANMRVPGGERSGTADESAVAD